MRGAALSKKEFHVDPDLFPNLGALTPPAQRQELQIIFHELAEKGIIENRPMRPVTDPVRGTGNRQELAAMPLGQQLCVYLLNQAKSPKKTP